MTNEQEQNDSEKEIRAATHRVLTVAKILAQVMPASEFSSSLDSDDNESLTQTD